MSGDVKKAEIYSASDYAGMRSKNLVAYFGYERCVCKECDGPCTQEVCSNDPEHMTEWCFVALIGEEEIKIPESKLRLPDTGEGSARVPLVGLLQGIAWLFERYVPQLPEKK